MLLSLEFESSPRMKFFSPRAAHLSCTLERTHRVDFFFSAAIGNRIGLSCAMHSWIDRRFNGVIFIEIEK